VDVLVEAAGTEEVQPAHRREAAAGPVERSRPAGCRAGVGAPRGRISVCGNRSASRGAESYRRSPVHLRGPILSCYLRVVLRRTAWSPVACADVTPWGQAQDHHT
jgi:hypothetical protein